MKRFFAAFLRALSSRALAPLVLGFFLLAYIVIAFFTPEALTVLITLTGRNVLLGAVLALLPLNAAARIAVEAARYLRRRKLENDPSLPSDPRLYDESVELAAPALIPELKGRLEGEGYRTMAAGGGLAAWRGLSLSPSRILFLAATLFLFGGILVSVTSRAVYRQNVIEGEPFPAPSGDGGMVQQIEYRKAQGPIMAKDLLLRVAEAGGAVKSFGVYPPGLYRGAFVYPRYLGVAMTYRFSAPELSEVHQNSAVFPIYPPGREASVAIPGSPYKITFTMEKPQDGSDPYMTGRFSFPFKLAKGNDLLCSGTVPLGGEFVKDGCRLSFIDARRMVVTDFVVDYGVLLIWGAGVLYLVAAFCWLPVRLFAPRREMLLISDGGVTRVFSRAEGRRRRHAGTFHGILDCVAGRDSSDSPTSAG